MNELSKKNILGVGITDASKESILQYIITSLRTTKDNYYIVTPNPEMLVSAKQNPSFRLILNQARIALPDGVGITFAARLLGKRLYQRITGTDFLDLLCREIAASNLPAGKAGVVTIGKPITVGFLGGRGGVAEKTAECLMKRYPELKVVFVAEEWDEDAKSKDQKAKSKNIDILFIAFGFPRQEEWMAEHIGKMPVRIMMGVGGAFDYISGSVLRAPLFLRWVGFEWLYRLISQPWRWKRQLSLFSFLWLVIKELNSSH